MKRKPPKAKPKDKPTKAPRVLDDELHKHTRGGGIPCPTCRSERSKVTRTAKLDGGQLRRIRRCLDCSRTYFTQESALDSSKSAIDLKTLFSMLESQFPNVLPNLKNESEATR